MPGDRCAIYTRVSTAEQAQGWSLSGQYDECRAYADRHGYKVVRRFEDAGASGRTVERDGFLRVVDCVKRNMLDVVVVWRNDRVGRNAVNNGLFRGILRHHAVRLENVQQGPTKQSAHQRLTDTMTDAWAEFESEMIAERLQMGRDTAARHGCWPTRSPFGYRRNKETGQLEVFEEEARFIREIFEATVRGVPRRHIAQLVGMPEPSVQARLAHPVYKGEATYNGIPVPCPPIVSAETWAKAHEAMQRRSPRNPARLYPNSPAYSQREPWARPFEDVLTEDPSAGSGRPA